MVGEEEGDSEGLGGERKTVNEVEDAIVVVLGA